MIQMRRIIFGLALVPFLACGSVSAGEGLALAGSDGMPKAEAPPPGKPAPAAKLAKRTPKRQSQPAAASSLQSAESYAADHSANSPTSSAAKPASPAAGSWTGFYLGAGGGIGRQ
jgi:hypothetical protein